MARPAGGAAGLYDRVGHLRERPARDAQLPASRPRHAAQLATAAPGAAGEGALAPQPQRQPILQTPSQSVALARVRITMRWSVPDSGSQTSPGRPRSCRTLASDAVPG